MWLVLMRNNLERIFSPRKTHRAELKECLRTVCHILGIPWQPGPGEATTLGGLLSETLERIPGVGEKIEWRGYDIEVLRADKRRVKRLVVRKSFTSGQSARPGQNPLSWM